MDHLRCPICLDPFTHPLVLSCGHTFDRKCLSKAKNCPLCREDIKSKTVNWLVVEALDLNLSANKSSGTDILFDSKIDQFTKLDGAAVAGLNAKWILDPGYRTIADQPEVTGSVIYVNTVWQEVGLWSSKDGCCGIYRFSDFKNLVIYRGKNVDMSMYMNLLNDQKVIVRGKNDETISGRLISFSIRYLERLRIGDSIYLFNIQGRKKIKGKLIDIDLQHGIKGLIHIKTFFGKKEIEIGDVWDLTFNR